MTADTIKLRFLGLFTAITDPVRSDFLREFWIYFYAVLVRAKTKGIRSLQNAVPSILSLPAKFKVSWIYARSIVLSRAFVKDASAFRNWSNKQNVRGFVSGNHLGLDRPCNPPVDVTVSSVQRGVPNPTPSYGINSKLRHEPFKDCGRKLLRFQVLVGKFNLHSVNIRPFGLQAQRAFSFSQLSL
jgi:hypothetical protein